MNPRTKAFSTRTNSSPARRRATRLAQAAAVFTTAAVAAISCTDGARLSGPLSPVAGPAVRGLRTHYNSVAPPERKTPWLVSGSAGPSSVKAPVVGPLASRALAGSGFEAKPIDFAPESGPFENLLPESDDDVFGPFDIGFDFTFFGNTYHEFYISTNGFISFEPISDEFGGCCAGRTIPLGDDINNMIAIAWTDLSMVYGQVGFETRGTKPNRRLVIDLQHVPVWGEGGAAVTAQLILREGSNSAELHTLGQGATSERHPVTQGAENPSGTEAAFMDGRVRASYALTSDAIRIGGPAADGNRAPSVSAGGNAGSPVDHYEGQEGQLIKFKASGSDADGDQLSYVWDFDGDGAVDKEGAEVEYAYNDNGNLSARVTASDGKGGSASAVVDVIVANVAPSAELKSPESVDEGGSIALSVDNVHDASEADQRAGFEFSFDCGDGFVGFGAASSVSCAVLDNGTRNVGVKVRDKNGGEASYTKSVVVRNVNPVVDAGPNVSAMSGQVVSLSGRFSDAGIADKMWKWSWSSGSWNSAVSSVGEQGGALAGQYRVCGAGPQQITLAVTDKDGGRGVGSMTVNVERLTVSMAVKPSKISLKGNDDGDSDGDWNDRGRAGNVQGGIVAVVLYSSASFDAGTMDPASVRLTNGSGKGTPLLRVRIPGRKDKAEEWGMISGVDLNRDGRRDVALLFSRASLIANGDLNASTTKLTVSGRAGTCLEVASSAPVQVKP